MSLSGALSIAQSALANTAAQSALLSKNIANVNNVDYSRESAGSLTQLSGAVLPGPTQRATDNALLTNLLSSQAASSSSQALSDGLTQIASTLGLDTSSTSGTATATDNSPTTLIGAFSDSLQQYASQPDNASQSTAAIDAAKLLARNLNQASASVQAVRAQADGDIAASVQTINTLLARFQVVNSQIVVGTRSGADVTAAQDARDGLLKQLSNEIGVTTTKGPDGGTSIYTDSGATLFETTARTVGFTKTNAFTAGTVGQAVTVDGVPVTGSSAVMAIKSGRLAGLTTLRDDTGVAYQNQLDQIASGLIGTFAESDQTGSGAPTLPGLFTASGLAAPPTAGDTIGLASRISVSANVDPSAGGVATRLRDGNIADPSNAAYTYNTTGAAAYSTRLQQLSSALSQTRTFDAGSGGAASATLATYAASSVSWLEAARQGASSDATYNSALVSTTTTALSNATGVNLDNEMSRMLDIEHAYQASAQLMNTVKAMYASLLQAFN